MVGIQFTRRITVSFLGSMLLLASCSSRPDVELASVRGDPIGAPQTSLTTVPSSSAPATATPSTATPSTATTPTSVPAPPTTAGAGLLAGGVDVATLVTSPEGDVLVQPTPVELQNRQLATRPLLPAPASDDYAFTVQPLEGDALQRSTWNELCPVPASDLRYLTVSFWGFDGIHHTGELVVAADEADNIVSVFAELHAIRFPIEEMRIVTPTDVVARRTGDGNNTASYVCRQVTGGTRFSEHALGLAVDINPFQNPYVRGLEVIPALAWSYTDRTNVRPGMIVAGDPSGDLVIAAFAEVGWSWGGDWNSLKDYQHFTLNNR